jgi:protein subunit release factor B
VEGSRVREKVFSVTIRDCRVDTFRAGGKGGQNQNKVESGVRVVHEPSGAVGEARDSRDQLQNKRAAFRRMAESRAFQLWARIEAARRVTGKTIDQLVDESIAPENLLVEVRGDDGRWMRAE